MKRKLIVVLMVVAALFIAGCDNPMNEDDGAKNSSSSTSRLVVVNGTDVVMLSVYMRPQGTSEWGPNLLAQCTPTGNLPAGGSCVIENIEFGTYDLHAYCYGNYYRYGVTFDTVEGKEWGFY